MTDMELTDLSVREFLARVPDATLVVDAAGVIQFASDRVQEVFGHAPSALVGSSIETLVPERFRHGHLQHRADYAVEPKAREMGALRDLYGLHQSGREFAIDISLSPIGQGPDQYVLCAIRDVSARRERRRSLQQTVQRLEIGIASSVAETRQSQENLRLFVDHAPAAVAMFDRQMRYLITSQRWLDDFGLGDRNIIGLSHYDVFPELPERWKEAHRRCLAGEVLGTAEDSFVRPDGRIDWLRWELLPWHTVSGAIGGLMIFTEDITERRQSEQALRRLNEDLERRVAERTDALEAAKDEAVRATSLKSRFLAAASHDLRQPLQATGMYLAVLQHQASTPDQRELLDKARQPLAAMAEILDTLLDVSKFESGAVRVRLSDFPVRKLLERVALENQAHAEARGLKLICEPCDCIAHSDAALLERVISNFVSNAIRYTERGQITLRCECNEARLQISVVDSGIGIPADALDVIFDEYVQLQNSARTRDKGLGLGLSIVKHIANLLGHRLTVQSVVGKGSTFTIDVPSGKQATARATAIEATPAASRAGHRPVLLLVDDDPFVPSSVGTCPRCSISR